MTPSVNVTKSTRNCGLVKFTEESVNKKLQFFEQCHLSHSHKKRKYSLEGSLDQVLLAAKLEFPKILAPRLPPQHTSNDPC